MPSAGKKALCRRDFLRSGIVAGVAASSGVSIFGSRALATATATKGALFTKMGINAPLSKAAAVAEAGADFLLVGVRDFLIPNEPETEFEKQLRLLEKSPIPILSCNSFLTDGPLRSIGPDAQHENVLRYSNTAFRRARRAGVERIIFGSSASRRLPKGWSQAQADAQFISLLGQMAELAEASGITVAVENLQRKECNYLTRIDEVGAIVSEVDHPNIRVLADLYHGSVMQDPPEDFQRYCHLIDMVEIAEAKGRTVPGVGGQDFRPYFKALRAGGYHGLIEIEGKWEIGDVAGAFATIREQASLS